MPHRRKRGDSIEPEDAHPDDNENAGTALYAAHQTTQYIAAPVINGLVPKNAYGNLDVYVPSMVPPGAVHIPHPDTSRAARTMGIDFADAVTGFSFKGRHGTAIVTGAVVASEHGEAVEAILHAYDNSKSEAEDTRRTLEALRVWKRLLIGLRIRQRIDGYEIEGERDAMIKEERNDISEEVTDMEEERGGFLLGDDSDNDPQRSAGRTQNSRPSETIGLEQGGFIAEDGGSESEKDSFPNFERQRPTYPLINSHKDSYGVSSPEDNGTTSSPEREQRAEETFHEKVTTPMAGSFEEPTLNLSHDELEEAMTLQQLHETASNENYHAITRNDTTEMIPSDGPMTEATLQTQAPPDDSLDTCREVKSASQSLHGEENTADASESPDPESDKGSLLSHDPDDEDADPDWIA